MPCLNGHPSQGRSVQCDDRWHAYALAVLQLALHHVAAVPNLAAVVHHEIGDITRFKNAKSLVAYAGPDPRIKQSGAMLNTTGRLTKRGSTALRHALFLAANVARRYDAELADYYAGKRAQGRSHREVLCIIARKLLYRINAILRSERPYHFLTPAERDSLDPATQQEMPPELSGGKMV